MKKKYTGIVLSLLVTLYINGCLNSVTDPENNNDQYVKLDLKQRPSIDSSEVVIGSYELFNNNTINIHNISSKDIEFDENKVYFSIDDLEDDVIIILTYLQEGEYINRRIHLREASAAALSYTVPIKGTLQAFIFNPASTRKDIYKINITSSTSNDSILVDSSQHAVVLQPTLFIEKSDLDLVAQHNFTFYYENYYDSTVCVLSHCKDHIIQNIKWNYTRVRPNSWTQLSLIGGDFNEIFSFYTYEIID